MRVSAHTPSVRRLLRAVALFVRSFYIISASLLFSPRCSRSLHRAHSHSRVYQTRTGHTLSFPDAKIWTTPQAAGQALDRSKKNKHTHTHTHTHLRSMTVLNCTANGIYQLETSAWVSGKVTFRSGMKVFACEGRAAFGRRTAGAATSVFIYKIR